MVASKFGTEAKKKRSEKTDAAEKVRTIRSRRMSDAAEAIRARKSPTDPETDGAMLLGYWLKCLGAG